MKPQIALLLTLAVTFVLVFLMFRGEITESPNQGAPIVTGIFTDEDHRVTPEMEAATAEMAGQTAPGFVSLADGGGTVELDDLLGTQPLVLIFIQDGCPCSASAETFFHQLHAAYGSSAAFLGVIDGDRDVAKHWADAFDTPYPILADPDLQIVQDYGVTNSAYVALIRKDGSIAQVWPGYSTGILQEISSQLAQLTGLPEASLDTDLAPELPYSGCPYPVDFEDSSAEVSDDSESLAEDLKASR